MALYAALIALTLIPIAVIVYDITRYWRDHNDARLFVACLLVIGLVIVALLFA